MLPPVEKSSGLNQGRNLHTSSSLQAKTALDKYDSGFWYDNRRWTFSLEEAWLWIMDSNFAQKQQFKIKNAFIRNLFLKTHSFWHLKTFIDGLEWCGLLWCFYQLIRLSFWRHPFTTEDPLVNKVMGCYISQNLLQKQTHLHLGWPEGEYIFVFVSVSLWCRSGVPKVGTELCRTVDRQEQDWAPLLY